MEFKINFDEIILNQILQKILENWLGIKQNSLENFEKICWKFWKKSFTLSLYVVKKFCEMW